MRHRQPRNKRHDEPFPTLRICLRLAFAVIHRTLNASRGHYRPSFAFGGGGSKRTSPSKRSVNTVNPGRVKAWVTKSPGLGAFNFQCTVKTLSLTASLLTCTL